MNASERRRAQERRLARHGRFSHVSWIRYAEALPAGRKVVMHFETARGENVRHDTVYALHHMRREKAL